MADPTHEDFRNAGMTGNAINHPLSYAAFVELCKFNGCTPEQAPRVWRWAPNEAVQAMWERKANEHQG